MTEYINGYCSRCGRKNTSALRCVCEMGFKENDYSTVIRQADETRNLKTQLAERDARISELEKMVDAYSKEFFRCSNALESCKEIANSAQFNSLKEMYFASLQEIEHVCITTLNRGLSDG